VKKEGNQLYQIPVKMDLNMLQYMCWQFFTDVGLTLTCQRDGEMLMSEGRNNELQ
jgi:hypothetical protein